MKWRLLRTGHNSGAWNMAVDEAIMIHVAKKAVPPTFRLYGWAPPTLSLGRLQSFERDVDPENCRNLGVDIVRRPTGGRAVLHDNEVTYSFIISEDDPLLPPNLRDSFYLATEGIVKGLSTLGLDAEIKGRQCAGGLADAYQSELRGNREANQNVQSGACFDSPSWYEVVAENKKLVGSAQARLKGVFLQHGSILITLDADKICRVLQYDDPDARALASTQLLEHATSIEAILGRPVSFQEIEEAVISGMKAHISPIELVEGELLPEELASAKDLISRKYRADAWTKRR
ncbi:MAG: lipoate--protein ligase family protein [Firmicutes bacterium]|nr:lipoate--protein ligase family protein [Bacillota bacterium]